MSAGSPFGMDYYLGGKIDLLARYFLLSSYTIFCLNSGKVFAGMFLAAMIAGLF